MLNLLIRTMIRDTVREIVVPVVTAAIAGYAMVRAAEIANRPKETK